MIEEMIPVLEYLQTSLAAQVMLACAIGLLALTLLLGMIGLRRRHRRDRAFFAPPIEGASEVFPTDPVGKRKVYVTDHAQYAKARPRPPDT